MKNLICPHCKEIVRKKKDDLICHKCNKIYSVKEGIHYFNNTVIDYPKELDENDHDVFFKKLSSDLNSGLDYLYKQNRFLHRYYTDSNRANGLFLLPTLKYKKILDVGCGSGIISHFLTKHAEEVYGIDICPNRLRFINIIKEKENIRNLILIGADIFSLPFPDNTFDLIILNGVLEWVGCAHRLEGPRDLQKEGLKNILGKLKKGGKLYLGIENRYGINYILGGKDHNNSRFSSLLPRALANSFNKLTNKKNYDTYTYSMKETNILLEESGFKKIMFYAAIPSYRFPYYIHPLDNDKDMKCIISKMLKENKDILPFHLKFLCKIALLLCRMKASKVIRFLVPSFIIIADK